MEFTVNIKEQNKIAAFLNLIKAFDYVEIVDVKEQPEKLFEEHKSLLDARLEKIEKGNMAFTDWDVIKEKYERKTV